MLVGFTDGALVDVGPFILNGTMIEAARGLADDVLVLLLFMVDRVAR